MVGDGSGGAIIAWQDARSSSNHDIFGQRVNSGGSAQWATNGVPVCTAAKDQGSLSAASDGSAGAIVTWQDSRNVTEDIYAQRVMASGWLSQPPNQPSNIAPADHEEGVCLTPTPKCSGFSPGEPGDTHVASQWRVTATAGDYSSPVFDSGPDSFGLLQATLDSGRLDGNTTYCWQVRHQGKNGLWSPWSLETSFTTQNRPPNQPAGIWPENGASGIGLTPTLQSSTFSDPDAGDTHVASQWRITTTPGDYGDPVFLTPELTSNLIQVTVESGHLTGNTTYYWQVRYKDDHGAWSDWSPEMNFTTLNRPPDQPTPVSPPAGGTGTSLSPTLESSAFSDLDISDTHAASQWQITTSAGNYGSPVFDSAHVAGSSLTSISVLACNLNPSTTYYWRVRYQDNHGAWSGWSEESSFTTQDVAANRAPDQPTCVAPENGAENVSTTPTLETSAFSDPDTDDSQAASQWQVTTTSGDYGDPMIDKVETLDSIAFSVKTLSSDTTYYWRVRYQDSHGAWSKWSEESSFTTKAEEAAGNSNKINTASWLYLAAIVMAAILAVAAVAWWSARANRLATN
jgi:transposase-like protein